MVAQVLVDKSGLKTMEKIETVAPFKQRSKLEKSLSQYFQRKNYHHPTTISHRMVTAVFCLSLHSEHILSLNAAQRWRSDSIAVQ